MAFAKVLALALVVAINLQEIYGHGLMWEPINRSSAWRKGFKVKPNYNDNEHFCGGQGVQHGKNDGKCGECGDDWSLPRPRSNENGGLYGTGTIVQTYRPGQIFTAIVNLTANHMGTFTFHLCQLKNKNEMETEECFVQNPLPLVSGGYAYPVHKGIRDFSMQLKLPEHIKCEHCVIRWNYRAGNTWGICPGGKGGMGCGPQETFRSCADVSIL